MQFLYPAVLWGLLALAIPLIIHLFNFRRTRKVLFTNVAFLKKVETETSSFRKLKQWLIMASRMLFIAALVMAFAQPFLPAKTDSGSGSAVGVNSLYLDNSLSMENTAANKRYLDLAIVKLDELLTLFKNAQNLQFLTNDYSGDDQFLSNASKIKDRLTSIIFSNSHRTLGSVYKRQEMLADKINHDTANNFFWFSDFQKSTSGNLSGLKLDSINKIYLVPVQSENVHNVFVDSVWMNSPFVREMQNNQVKVELHNSGNEAITDLPVKLVMDNTQSSTASVSIPPSGSAIANFSFTVREKGVHRGEISFEDQPVNFDNKYYFVINASPPVDILHLYQNKSRADYVSRMYANDSMFVYNSANVNNIDPARIQLADLVVLEGIISPDAGLRTALIPFITKGGSLLIIPAANMDSVAYNTLLSPFGISNLSKHTYNADEPKVDMMEPDRGNPFFADVFDRGESNTHINVPAVWPNIQWTGAGENLLTLRNGNRFLTKTNFAAGLVYLLASSLEPEYGNFAEHAFFVPTLFKIAALSIKPQRLAYNFSEAVIELPLSDSPPNAIYKLKNNELEILPVQRVVGKNVILELPNTADMSAEDELRSGFYELLIDNKPSDLLAINHASVESEMEFYKPEELKEIFAKNPNVTVFDNILDGDFVSTFAANNFGKSLWKYFLFAALFFLLIEILLIRFIKS